MHANILCIYICKYICIYIYIYICKYTLYMHICNVLYITKNQNWEENIFVVSYFLMFLALKICHLS